jgi:hypothetical protein
MRKVPSKIPSMAPQCIAIAGEFTCEARPWKNPGCVGGGSQRSDLTICLEVTTDFEYKKES